MADAKEDRFAIFKRLIHELEDESRRPSNLSKELGFHYYALNNLLIRGVEEGIFERCDCAPDSLYHLTEEGEKLRDFLEEHGPIKGFLDPAYGPKIKKILGTSKRGEYERKADVLKAVASVEKDIDIVMGMKGVVKTKGSLRSDIISEARINSCKFYIEELVEEGYIDRFSDQRYRGVGGSVKSIYRLSKKGLDLLRSETNP